MARKLTPELVSKIRELRARGLKRDEIAAKIGLSAGSVSNALRSEPKPAPRRGAAQPPAGRVPDAAPPDADAGSSEPPESLPPPSEEELRVYFADQLREFRSDCERARAAGDDVALARGQRALVQTSTLLARVTKNAPAADGFVMVEIAAMQDAADRCIAKLHDYVDRQFDELEKQPVCPACGQHLKPPAEGG